MPTTAIVTSGPYRSTRNPIYLAMLLGQIGLTVGFDAWILATMVPFYLLIRYGVIAREEAYLERRFGETYVSYKAPSGVGCGRDGLRIGGAKTTERLPTNRAGIMLAAGAANA